MLELWVWTITLKLNHWKLPCCLKLFNNWMRISILCKWNITFPPYILHKHIEFYLTIVKKFPAFFYVGKWKNKISWKKRNWSTLTCLHMNTFQFFPLLHNNNEISYRHIIGIWFLTNPPPHHPPTQLVVTPVVAPGYYCSVCVCVLKDSAN